VADQREADEDSRRTSRRIADEIGSAIEDGTYAIGTALPPVRTLAAEHGAAVNTALAALRLLVDEGYAVHRSNAGYYVRDRSAQSDAGQELRTLRAELGELYDQVREASGNLAEIQTRLSALSDMVARLENDYPST
jgi:DNA-binding transcriptional regulator YhcF (GntR family)